MHHGELIKQDDVCKLSCKILARQGRRMGIVWDPKWITSFTFWFSWSNPVPFSSKNNKFSFDTLIIISTELGLLTKHKFWRQSSRFINIMAYINPQELQPKYIWLHNQRRKEPPVSVMGVLIAFPRVLGQIAACAAWRRKPEAATARVSNWEHRHKL